MSGCCIQERYLEVALNSLITFCLKELVIISDKRNVVGIKQIVIIRKSDILIS